jgi:hypothetical protein
MRLKEYVMFNQYGPLAAAVGLLAGSAFQAKDRGGSDGIVLGTAGLIVLGAWLVITVYTIIQESKSMEKEYEATEDDTYEDEDDSDG